MTEKKKEKVSTRDFVYEGVAKAIAEAYGLTEVPRVKEGLHLQYPDENGEDKDIIVRVIEKKNPIDEAPKTTYTFG